MVLFLKKHQWLQTGLIPAVLAGVIWACAFPAVGIAGLGWLAPGLVLYVAGTNAARQPFSLGYAAGLVYSLLSLYWLLYNPVFIGALAAWFALSAYLALFPATWAWMCWRMAPAGLLGGHETQATTGWLRQQGWALAGATAWVGLENLRGWFLSGFPWNNLAVSQYQMLPLIQMCAWTGTAGLSFLMVWFSLGLLQGVCSLRGMHRPGWRNFLPPIVMPLVLVMALYAVGYHRMRHAPVASRTVKVALVQPSIPQNLIWDASENTNRFNKLIQLSKTALAIKPDLLLWPEAAIPNVLRYDPEFTCRGVTNLALEYGTWMIVGADDAEPAPHQRTPDDYVFFNSSFLVSPSGDLVSQYRKQKLVIFGEYVPLQQYLPFLKWLIPTGDGFKPGTHPVPFRMPSLGVEVSSLICFEDVFCDVARKAVADDTDFLVNLTNNGWFGESAAQWQHAANAVFRAVENGVPLVRCANNGLTCWVDPLGGMHEVYFGDSKDIYGAGFKVAQVPVYGKNNTLRPTVFHRLGDGLGCLCFIFTIGLGGILIVKRQRTASSALPS